MKKLIIILCIICLAALLAAPAAWTYDRNARYACKCKGIENKILFWSTYSNCGGGFTGGSQGKIVKYITNDGLDRYLPPQVASSVKEGNGCEYYAHSGWNCGKKSGESLPACIND